MALKPQFAEKLPFFVIDKFLKKVKTRKNTQRRFYSEKPDFLFHLHVDAFYPEKNKLRRHR